MSKLMNCAAQVAAAVLVVVMLSGCAMIFAPLESTPPAPVVEEGFTLTFDSTQYCAIAEQSGLTYQVSPNDAMVILIEWPYIMEYGNLSVEIGDSDSNGCRRIKSVESANGGQRWVNTQLD